MRKSIIRLMMFGDEDMKVIPIYFDRLKMFWKVRKLWRFVLSRISYHQDRLNNKHSLSKHFGRWRRRTERIQSELQKLSLD